MSNDIIEIKPRFGPIVFNVNALVRRFRRKKSENEALVGVATRFLHLFRAHGIAKSQIPRFLPTLNLGSLSTTESLLAALTPAVLDEAASLFGVQRGWLECTTETIFPSRCCYKRAAVMFEMLSRMKVDLGSFPVRALTSVKELSNRSSDRQPLALVLVEKIAEPDDDKKIWDIARYQVFADAWDWGHPPCRIQLKAMVRVIDQVIGERVPLFRVKPSDLDAVLEGRRVPREFVNRCLLTEPSLEDYACSLAEHAKAKETEELPAVLRYIEEFDLPPCPLGETRFSSGRFP